jgi:D-alanyl-D-alanine carboxypeptidase/D-alanyl-D-alanine-endopeptidase (penicillin-binding protein 4)
MRCFQPVPRTLKYCPVLAALLLTVALPAPAEPDGRTVRRVEAVINAQDFKQSRWGILVTDLVGKETIYEHDADKLFAPASVTKLYSAASALDALGADFQFRTPVYRRGELDEEGELNGDLILVAKGDLSFGGRTDGEGRISFKDVDHIYANGNGKAELTEPDPLAGLNELARQVSAAGIKRVRGEVLVDDRMFDKAEGSGSGPVRLTPIVINDNVLDITITPSLPDSPANVNWRPRTQMYRVDSQVETVAKGKETRVQIIVPSAGRVLVRGQIAEDQKPLLRVHEVEDAASFARSLFIEALRRNGVRVDASPIMNNRPELLSVRDFYRREDRVAQLTSPPFSESIRLILKVSHNLHASLLPLLTAAKHGKRTLAEGMLLEKEFLDRAGLDVDTISFGGGAGGSSGDWTTPRATVQLLHHMSTRPDFQAYEAALPLMGVDGTLAQTVDQNSPVRARVRAKTGTLYWDNLLNERFLLKSKGLAGYLNTESGRKLAFAFFVNNAHLQTADDTARIGKVLARLCEIFYDNE